MNKTLLQVETLLKRYARHTLDVMIRLNALEKALGDVAPDLQKKYLEQYDLARNQISHPLQQRIERAETELDYAIAELRSLLK